MQKDEASRLTEPTDRPTDANRKTWQTSECVSASASAFCSLLLLFAFAFACHAGVLRSASVFCIRVRVYIRIRGPESSVSVTGERNHSITERGYAAAAAAAVRVASYKQARNPIAGWPG